MDLLVITLCLGAAVSLLLFAISSAAVWVVSGRKPARAPAFPVSILKPLKGLDDGLWENLISLVEQQHPAFELVLGAEDAADPALEVARRLRRAFPDVRIAIVAGAPRVALNPKVSLLLALSRAAWESLEDWSGLGSVRFAAGVTTRARGRLKGDNDARITREPTR